MNYKDALTHPINTKLTKAQLVEISKRLQVECLANELTTPLIPFNSYIKDVRNVVSYVKDKARTLSNI